MGRNSFNAAEYHKASLNKQRATRLGAAWQRKQPNPYAKRTPPVPTLDEEARASRTAHLTTAAKAAKLTDLDLLKIARPDLTAEAAIADLKARYPGGFAVEQVKTFAAMTEAEQADFRRIHGIKGPRP